MINNTELKQKLLEATVKLHVTDPANGLRPDTLKRVTGFVQDDFFVDNEGQILHREMQNSYSLEEWFDEQLPKEEYLFTDEWKEQRRRELILATDPSQRQMNEMSDRQLWSSVPDQQERHNA